MSCNWPRVQISEVCELIVDCVNKTAPRVDYETPFKMIRTPNVKGGKISLNDCRFVEADTYEKWTRRAKVLRDDVLLTREAPMGEVGIVDFDDTVFLGQRIMQYRVDRSKLDPHFLLYSFLSSDLQHQFNMHEGSGSVVSHIRVPDCSKFELNLPPLNIQKEIADVLKKLDRKISVNQQTNQTLEEMAQAIFKSWFVDFDPVKAKMNGEQPEGMDGATASLFPEQLVESELGLIPEGWDIATIKDFGSVICGKTPSKKNAEFYGGDVPFIKIPDTHGKVFITETTDSLTQAGDESQPKKRIPENSICVSCIATVGQVFITTKPSHTNQQINSVVPHDSNSLYYLLFKFKGLSKHFHDLASGGSATLNMNTRTFSNVELVRPTADVMEAFHNMIGGLMQKMLTNQLENATLAELRDTLLPKLLSGEIELDKE